MGQALHQAIIALIISTFKIEAILGNEKAVRRSNLRPTSALDGAALAWRLPALKRRRSGHGCR